MGLHHACGNLSQLSRMTADDELLHAQFQRTVQHKADEIAHLYNGYAGTNALQGFLPLISEGENDGLRTLYGCLLYTSRCV